MTTGLGQKSRSAVGAAAVSLASTADNIVSFAGPAKIYRLGLHVTVAKTTGTALVISVQSVAGVTESVLGTATSPDTMAAGQNLYKEFNPPLVVPAGSFGKAEITTASNDGSGRVWLDFVEDPLTKSYLDGLTVLT